MRGKRIIHAPRGKERSCKGWHQEAAMRMLMNNLDSDVAEDPDRLVVYGGTGRAARSWEAFDAIVRSLRGLEVDPARIEKRLKSGYCDKIAWSLDEALKLIDQARKEGHPISVGLVGNCADVLPEIAKRGVVPDVLTDQTSAHDALNGYVPHGMSLKDALALRAKKPEEYIDKAMHSMAVHVDAMLALKKKGAITFDYGNNIRAQAKKAGVENAFDITGFVPEYIRPLFCEGRGPFRWVALSGDAADTDRTGER